LILIDVSIENVKGIEILKEIREKRKINLPAIVFSIFRDEELEKKAKKLKINDFVIGAEILPDELVKRIKKILK